MSGLIELPESEILSQLESEDLSPSGLAIDDVTGNLLIIAAQQRVVVEISDSGELIHVREMPLAKRHRQAEGIEITRAGRLLIGDEGSGRKARIAVYRTAEATDEERQ